MKNRYLLLAALVMGMGADFSALADPPPWAPAHGRRAKEMQPEVVEVRPVVRQYNYIYYPAYQVYYAPDSQMWFWMSGGNWQFGMNLPVQYSRYSYAGGGVTVMLNSDRPFVEHAYVERTYGRPWREKHGHREDHDRRDDDRHGDRRGHRD
ncbi:hypothetical protein [Noviherbaspirillum sp. UKPF54]|uniref:hypothetical protein n=1 Tax=Noviherbaspirillum sp. UKPF54 TaxID=2601898 RepID=UPI0011B1311C|nr:hypothetical protein [Noviherbaspirillum sp. UKPF54]QDZ26718.1 hypothetical protein FAY22_01260 [Noviherbaspirillum sp. UKPF54]